jgi:patatin-like phospholipase/acyl hydrolase
MKRNYNILSIDGGGIRGVMPLKQLVEFEKENNIRVQDFFDFFTGTSTGGIIAVLLAKGMSPAEILDFYLVHGPKIFERKFFRQGIFSLGRPKYDDTYFNNVLKEVCGDQLLSELEFKVLVPAVKTSPKQELVLFKNTNEFSDVMLRDAIRATASAQTYFKPHTIKGCKYIDGGMGANNPTDLAKAEFDDTIDSKVLNILSCGTGVVDDPIKIKKGGLLAWAKPTVDILLSQSSKKTHNIVKRNFKKLPGKYLRIDNIPYSSSEEIDDASEKNIKALIADGYEAYQTNREAMKQFLEQITG